MLKSSWMFVVLLLAVGFAAMAGFAAEPGQPLLLISEVRPGSLASDQRCTLIFSDHRYHHEIAARRHGRDIDRKVYEGQLSDAEWTALKGALDSKEFHDIDVPASIPALVLQDVHSYTISVNRGGKFQNMEFLTNKSRKPYDAQLKPLLQWWKSFYDGKLAQSASEPAPQCSLDNSKDAVFAN